MTERNEVATDLAAAQADMRHGYFWGAPGMLASSIAWLCAGIATLQASPRQAVWVLFIGGMLIHPAGVLLCKAMGRPGGHARGNPLAGLAMASTAWMIFCLPLAYAISLQRIEWFFPAMLMVIGGRYLTFDTLFGVRVYWACGFALGGAGYLLARFGAGPTMGAFTGSAIEMAFAAAILVMARRSPHPVTA